MSDSRNQSGRCVFLDRDGVLNEEVYYESSQEWEGPLKQQDLVLCFGVTEALLRLQRAGFCLIIVSNQAAFAKGKAALVDLIAVHDRLISLLSPHGIGFLECNYSYTHPDGIVPGFSGASLERKPGSYFLLVAAARHNLDLSSSWMVGDRDTDILCGQNAGARTIQVSNARAGAKAGKILPDFRAAALPEAVDIILELDKCAPFVCALYSRKGGGMTKLSAR